MRKFVLAAILAVLPLLSGCAWSDVFYGLFGHAYSGGGASDAARYQDYSDKVRAANAPSGIPSASANPF
jgi:hypothetical protein